MPPQAGPTTQLVCGLVVAGLGVLAGLEAWRLGPGSLGAPGSGTWPLVLSALLVVLGICIAFRAKVLQDAEKLTTTAIAVGAGAVILLVTTQLMPLIGFEIPAVVLMVVWMRVLGGEKYRLSVPLSLATVFITYLIFITGLGVPLPRLF